jgi:FMN-dependent NADH-azoreductase
MYLPLLYKTNNKMKKILNIVSSVKGENSFSAKLSDTLIEKLLSVYPGSTVITRDLARNPFPHFEESNFTAFYTPEVSRTKEHKDALINSDAAIKSTLKSWIDHIARAGVTFSYADGAPKGLVVDKKVYLAIASGGVYSEGPMKDYDFSESYLRAVLGFIGMKDITVFRIEGTAVPGVKETALPKAVESVSEYAF